MAVTGTIRCCEFVGDRGEDGMIHSGSDDGTVWRWESIGGQALPCDWTSCGSPTEEHGRVYTVAVSCDGKRIAYAADKLVGVLDAGSGVLRRVFVSYW